MRARCAAFITDLVITISMCGQVGCHGERVAATSPGGSGLTLPEYRMIVGLLALVVASADTTCRVALTAGASLSLGTMAPAIVVDCAAASRAPSRLEPPPIALQLRPFHVQPVATVPRKKRMPVEHSDWYGRRPTVHRTLARAMIPPFGLAHATGTWLARDGRTNSPCWVRATHPWVATADVALVGINTITGAWVLWDARHDPERRTTGTVHSALFMVADAGSPGEDARNDGAVRNRHYASATPSMGVSTAGWLIMPIGT